MLVPVNETLNRLSPWMIAVFRIVVGFMLFCHTRGAAFLGSGTLAVAYFWKHQPDGFLPIQNEGDSAALFSIALLLLVFTGPGRLALGSVLRNRSSVQKYDSAAAPTSLSSV